MLFNDEAPVNSMDLWPSFEHLLTKKDLPSVYNLIEKYSSPDNRNAIYRLLIRKIAFGKWSNDFIDIMIELGDRAIDEAIAASKELPEKQLYWTDQANVTAYNVGTNLCDCWADNYKRNTTHFNKGLQLAEKAIAFRKELKKTDVPMAMAYWLKGKHLLSLGRAKDAEQAFEAAVDYEKKVATKISKPTQLVEDAPNSLINAMGFLGIAQSKNGQPAGDSLYSSALSVLETKLKKADPAQVEEIQFFIDQLKVTSQLTAS